MYYNRRVEIWGVMRDSLKDGVELPDDPELRADLAAPEVHFRHQGRDGRDPPGVQGGHALTRHRLAGLRRRLGNDESGIAVRVRSTIKPYALRCIFLCPSAIKTRTDDEWIVVSSVSEVMGERDHGP
jgi:hypothetical protein